MRWRTADMAVKRPQDQIQRKANLRLALILGAFALVFYLVMVVFKPMMGAW